MYSQRVRRVMESAQLLTTTPASTVFEAARMMAAGKTGAVLVVVDGQLAGIFTESDAVARVIAGGRDPLHTPLADVMTPAPLSVGPDVTFGRALQLMHEHGFNHLPVVEDGRTLGVVSTRNAMDPEMEEYVCEALRREGPR